MSEYRSSYGWADYYKKACEREKKQNNMLAAKIAEAEAKQEDLRFRLNRIYSNPFWKMTAPLRKIYHGMQGDGRPNREEVENTEKDSCLLRYEEEIWRQKQPYLQWIKETETAVDTDSSSDTAFSEEGMWKAAVPESDIILIGYGRGRLHPNTFATVKTWFDENKSCQLAYADEDYYWGNVAQRMQPWFKPAYSPDTLLSFNYFGHMLAVRTDLAKRVKVNTSLAASVQFYDLCLRLEEICIQNNLLGEKRSGQIGHISAVLFHNEYEPPQDKKEELGAIESAQERFLFVEQCLISELESGKYLTGAGGDCRFIRETALARRGIHATLKIGQNPDIYHVVYEMVISGQDRCARVRNHFNAVSSQLLVSVVIPSKDHPKLLKNCLDSFLRKTKYESYEFIIVDNGSAQENRAYIGDELEKELRSLCARMRKPGDFGYTYLYEPMEFNFSKMCNLGVQHANGDLILLLNDDIEVIEGDWLMRMAGQAVQPHVGAVGAKLWYAGTEQIQHAGITNLQIGPSHKLITFPDDKDYYYGRNTVTYDMIGVTAACMLVSKEKYEEVGGMDESMAVAYNDVDFCFKLSEAGYYNVLRNDAVLYHHESASRGLDEQDDGKWDRLLVEKENLYHRHPLLKGKDEFYHSALIDNDSNYRCNYKFAYEDRLLTVTPERLASSALKGASEDILQLTVDRAEIQHKIYAQEADILWIMGWCYVPGADNAVYDKKVILKAEGAEGYMAQPSNQYRRDVEAILQQECNIGLAGFVLRVKKEDLQAGEYRVGMLCADRISGRKVIGWSDKTVVMQ